MTRQCNLYSIKYTVKGHQEEVYYRDLTVLELAFLSNIKTLPIRLETAGKLALYNKTDVPFPTLLKIGEDILNRAYTDKQDTQLLEIYVREFREKISQDDNLQMIKTILQYFPGQSVTDLFNLTYKDLIEIVCLCEASIGKNIFKYGKGGLVNTKDLPDGGKSMQAKFDKISKDFPK